MSLKTLSVIWTLISSSSLERAIGLQLNSQSHAGLLFVTFFFLVLHLSTAFLLSFLFTIALCLSVRIQTGDRIFIYAFTGRFYVLHVVPFWFPIPMENSGRFSDFQPRFEPTASVSLTRGQCRDHQTYFIHASSQAKRNTILSKRTNRFFVPCQ